MLEIKNVVKNYDNVKAVDNLSIMVEPGGIYGLLGPNGAGKSTTIRMIMGIIQPDEGEIKLFNEPFNEKVKEKIGYLPEERGLYRRMKVLDHLVFLGEIKGVPAKVARKRGMEWLERVDLTEWADKNVDALSKGMQQKIQFVSTVLHDPKLVILDEPFAGLDPINTQFLKDIVIEMKEQGKTIILSTHLMEQVEKLCEKICLINKGKKELEGYLSDIKLDFSRNVISLGFSGDITLLENHPDVEKVRSFGQDLSITMKEGANPDNILRAAIDNGKVDSFEIGEMSLHDIFITKIKEEGGEVENEIIENS